MARLEMIARDMERVAQRRGVVNRELARGLALCLAWAGGTKTLELSRPVVRPSEQEVEICRAAFGVPADAQRLDGDMSVTLRWAA